MPSNPLGNLMPENGSSGASGKSTKIVKDLSGAISNDLKRSIKDATAALSTMNKELDKTLDKARRVHNMQTGSSSGKTLGIATGTFTTGGSPGITQGSSYGKGFTFVGGSTSKELVPYRGALVPYQGGGREVVPYQSREVVPYQSRGGAVVPYQGGGGGGDAPGTPPAQRSGGWGAFATKAALSVGAFAYGSLPDTNAAVAQRVASQSAATYTGMSANQMTSMTNNIMLKSGGITGSYDAQLAAANMLYSGGYLATSGTFKNMMPQVGGISAMTGMSNPQVTAALSTMSGSNALSLGLNIRDKKGNLKDPSTIGNQLYRRMYGNRKVTAEQAAMVYNPNSRAHQTVMAAAGGDVDTFNIMAEMVRAQAANGGKKVDLSNADKVMDKMGYAKDDPRRSLFNRNAAESKLLEKSSSGLLSGYNAANNASAAVSNGMAGLADVLPGVVTGMAALKGTLETLPGAGNAGASLSGVASSVVGGISEQIGSSLAMRALGIKSEGGGITSVLKNAATSKLGGSKTGSAVLKAASGGKNLMSKAGSFLKGPGGKVLGKLGGAAGLAASVFGGYSTAINAAENGEGFDWGNLLENTLLGGVSGFMVGGPMGALVGAGVGAASYGLGNAMAVQQSPEGSGTATTSSAATSAIPGLIQNAKSYAGRVPYVLGGESTDGWDCSGFVQTMFKKIGIHLPRTAREQAKMGTAIGSLKDAKPGDLLFFRYSHNYIDHVAIYIGNNKVVEAANKKAGTRIAGVDTKHLVAIRRVMGSKVGGSYQNLVGPTQNITGVQGDLGVGTSVNGSANNGLSVDYKGVSSSGAATVESILQSATSVTGQSMNDIYSVSGEAGDSSYSNSSGPQKSVNPVQGKELAKLLYNGGYKVPKKLTTAFGVAMKESGGRPRAFNNKGKDLSYGLFQINMIGDLGPDRRKRYGLKKNEDLFDPETNVRVAWDISGNGGHWTPWSTYNDGSYKEYNKAALKSAKEAQLPGYATGAWDVAKDQIARIHKGEMIVPAPYAEEARRASRSSSSSGYGGNVTVNMNVTISSASSESEVAKMARRVKQIWEQELNSMQSGRY